MRCGHIIHGSQLLCDQQQVHTACQTSYILPASWQVVNDGKACDYLPCVLHDNTYLDVIDEREVCVRTCHFQAQTSFHRV